MYNRKEDRMRKVKLSAGNTKTFIWLNSSRSSQALWDSLPLTGKAHTWGKEIYFEVPIKMEPENPHELVSFGDVGYWPEGGAICLFFGPTPMSRGDEIRPASPVNLLGRIINDPMVLGGIQEADVTLEKVKREDEYIVIGTDEHTPLVDAVAEHLKEESYSFELYKPLPWPEAAEKVGKSVARGEASEGILFCWTGTGVSVAANKVPGVRAALCHDAATAAGARKWNHANVLVMGLRLTSPAVAREILDSWFNTPFEEDEVENVTKVAEMEKGRGANGEAQKA